jgi:hypothetical protein
MLLTENSQKWSNIIAEELGVKDQNKLSWMSQYAQNHEIYEAVQQGDPAAGIYSTPLNTLGMGNPMMPTGVGYAKGTGIGNTGADFHNKAYQTGSGDIPMSTLTMSLEVAAMTIGLELVPVIPASGPWAMLSYMDLPYAGGKLGKINETALDGKGENDSNKPIYIKFYVAGANKFETPMAPKAKVTVGGFEGEFIGFSRIDNSVIVKVVKCSSKDMSIADEFAKATSVVLGDNKPITVAAGAVRADLVSGAADHVQGFSNFFDGGNDPMTRAQNETGVGNTIGARMFTKLVQMGSYEVTGSVTRQQLQDMPLYGVDVIGKVLEAMQNEISQAINNRILDRLFKLGVTNAKVQKDYQGVDLNLYFGTVSSDKCPLKNFPGADKFVGIDEVNVAANWGDIANATKNTAAENVATHQRRIMSRILAAANLITNVSRFGRPNFVVTNTKILSALQDCAGFILAPMTNTLVQDGSSSLYFAGSVAGLNLYVDPFMTWYDTRVLVGRKGDGNTPGVVFMPYILADTVQTIVEGTMAPKLLVNSRFAIVDAGFHPEQQYLTFMVHSDGDFIL